MTYLELCWRIACVGVSAQPRALRTVSPATCPHAPYRSEFPRRLICSTLFRIQTLFSVDDCPCGSLSDCRVRRALDMSRQPPYSLSGSRRSCSLSISSGGCVRSAVYLFLRVCFVGYSAYVRPEARQNLLGRLLRTIPGPAAGIVPLWSVMLVSLASCHWVQF